jgi:hypothetical protein
LLIHGLRRSGTTILWETFRSDGRLRCFDEPFHPRLAKGARENHKGTWTEFAAELDILSAPVAISPQGELHQGAEAHEQAWLASLGAKADRVAIDIVRGWNRLPALHAELDHAVSVHIVRDPVGWVGAHLLPSGKPTTQLRRLGNLWRKASFFGRHGGYDGYQYEYIVRAALDQDHAVFSHVARDTAELRRAPAYIKLLAFWWGANVILARGLAETGHPLVTVTLAEFSDAPAREIGRIAAAAGWHDLKITTNRVRPLPIARSLEDPRWCAAAAWLDMPSGLFEPGGACAERLLAVFAHALEASP